jgi:hypothetical protein
MSKTQRKPLVLKARNPQISSRVDVEVAQSQDGKVQLTMPESLNHSFKDVSIT